MPRTRRASPCFASAKRHLGARHTHVSQSLRHRVQTYGHANKAAGRLRAELPRVLRSAHLPPVTALGRTAEGVGRAVANNRQSGRAVSVVAERKTTGFRALATVDDAQHGLSLGTGTLNQQRNVVALVLEHREPGSGFLIGRIELHLRRRLEHRVLLPPREEGRLTGTGQRVGPRLEPELSVLAADAQPALAWRAQHHPLRRNPRRDELLPDRE